MLPLVQGVHCPFFLNTRRLASEVTNTIVACGGLGIGWKGTPASTPAQWVWQRQCHLWQVAKVYVARAPSRGGCISRHYQALLVCWCTSALFARSFSTLNHDKAQHRRTTLSSFLLSVACSEVVDICPSINACAATEVAACASGALPIGFQTRRLANEVTNTIVACGGLGIGWKGTPANTPAQ